MLFDKSVFFLWPDGIQHNYVLLFLSDAVPHMIKAGAVIKNITLENDVRYLCLAHSMPRIIEEFCGKFPCADKLRPRVNNFSLNYVSHKII